MLLLFKTKLCICLMILALCHNTIQQQRLYQIQTGTYGIKFEKIINYYGSFVAFYDQELTVPATSYAAKTTADCRMIGNVTRNNVVSTGMISNGTIDCRVTNSSITTLKLGPKRGMVTYCINILDDFYPANDGFYYVRTVAKVNLQSSILSCYNNFTRGRVIANTFDKQLLLVAYLLRRNITSAIVGVTVANGTATWDDGTPFLEISSNHIGSSSWQGVTFNSSGIFTFIPGTAMSYAVCTYDIFSFAGSNFTVNTTNKYVTISSTANSVLSNLTNSSALSILINNFVSNLLYNSSFSSSLTNSSFSSSLANSSFADSLANGSVLSSLINSFVAENLANSSAANFLTHIAILSNLISNFTNISDASSLINSLLTSSMRNSSGFNSLINSFAANNFFNFSDSLFASSLTNNSVASSLISSFIANSLSNSSVASGLTSNSTLSTFLNFVASSLANFTLKSSLTNISAANILINSFVASSLANSSSVLSILTNTSLSSQPAYSLFTFLLGR